MKPGLPANTNRPPAANFNRAPAAAAGRAAGRSAAAAANARYLANAAGRKALPSPLYTALALQLTANAVLDDLFNHPWNKQGTVRDFRPNQYWEGNAWFGYAVELGPGWLRYSNNSPTPPVQSAFTWKDWYTGKFMFTPPAGIWEHLYKQPDNATGLYAVYTYNGTAAPGQPFRKPQPRIDPRPNHWPRTPYPHYNPTPSEQPQRQPRPNSVRMRRAPSRGHGTVSIQAPRGGGRPSLRIGFRNTPPPRGTRETKARQKGLAPWMVVKRAIDEGMDLVDLLEVAAKATGYNGPVGARWADSMLEHIINHLDEFDLDVFIEEFAYMYLEDLVIGYLSRGAAQVARETNRPLGFEAGPLL